MSDNRIFSKDACTVCGRLGDPHAEWCSEMTVLLKREHDIAAPNQFSGSRPYPLASK